MFAAKNLSSVEMFPTVPWEFTRSEEIPSFVLGKDGKKARHEWVLNPKTEWNVYTLFEGVNPNLRIRAGNGKDDEGNPPHAADGLAVDYDLPLTEIEIAAALARMDILPNWIETTMSGHVRMVWLFERAILFPSYAFAAGFMPFLASVIPFRQLAGIDEGALKAPERLFTNGARWKHVSDKKVSYNRLLGALMEYSRKFDWKGRDFGLEIPLTLLADELRKHYPRFASWPGEFALGSQGPSFWVDGSVSEKSAIVRETGIQTFAGHATKSFYSWKDLVGAKFCDGFQADRLGASVRDIYFDDKTYYSLNAAGLWCADPKENIIGLLKTERGITDIKKKGESVSELDRALVFIQRSQRVKTAAPFAFYPSGRIEINGMTVLNTHTIKALAPAPEPGPFPFIEEFLRTLFLPTEQLDYFYSWLSRFYKGCYLRQPRSGHAVFIAGGPSVGKTFLSRAIIGRLVGGFAEAHQYLLGLDQFNSELFDHALWVVDDGSIAAEAGAHKRFSEMVKRIVANPTVRCNGKFLKAATVQWQGRQFFTLNTDAESARQLPDTDLSLREKIMVFRAVEEPAIKFQEQDEMEKILSRELPFLARFLLDYQIPEHCISPDPRFGIVAYHEKSLMEVATQSSVSGTFAEVLEEFLRMHYTEREPAASFWRGTALQLHKAILLDPTMTEAMRPFNVQSTGRMLVSLSAKKTFPIEVDGGDQRRVFTIHRDERRFPRKGTQIPNHSPL